MRVIPMRPAAAILLVGLGCSADNVASPDPADAGAAFNELSVQSVACGQSVVTDLTLTHDLSCAGDGLIVEADNIIIDLNGHVIAGSGTGNGITVRARHHVEIHGGTVRSFVTGIFVANSNNVYIHDTHVTQNREGIFLNGSSDNVLKNNVATLNQLRGFMLRPTLSGVISTRNLVKENLIQGNPSGILVFGQPGNTFKENTISGSSFAAFDLTGGGAADNLFKENLLENSAAGFRFGPGWVDNNVIENWLVQNACGVQGTATGNTLEENQFLGNTLDFC